MRWPSALAAFTVLLVLGGFALWNPRGPERPTGHRAQRIVSMAPNLTEIVRYLGAGGRLVGVTSFCQGVPEALPRIGTLIAPNFERIVALRPDLVLGIESETQAQIFTALRGRGFEVVSFPGESISDVRAAVEQIGALVEAEDRARGFVTELDARLEGLAARSRDDAPRVLFVVNRGPIWVAGGGSFVDVMIRAAGGQNLFHDLERPWAQVDLEEIVQREPDLIVDTTLDDSPEAVGDAWGHFAPHLDAVGKGRVHPFPAVWAGVQIPDWIDRLTELCRRAEPLER